MINEITFPGLGLKFEVSRVAFRLFGLSVYWYGILIALGLILAIVYGVREANRTGLSQDDLLNMILIAVPAAIVCARLYYVVFSWICTRTICFLCLTFEAAAWRFTAV